MNRIFLKIIPVLILFLISQSCSDKSVNVYITPKADKKTFNISGLVYDSLSLKHLKNSKVWIEKFKDTIFTNASGYFFISDLENGNYNLKINRFNYFSKEIKIDSSLIDTIFVEIKLLKIPFQKGTYKGTFIITENYKTDSAVTYSGPAEFRFYDSTYNCWGPFPFGGGAYYLEDDVLILKDQIGHLADFDWSYILVGPYNYRYDGLKLSLQQLDSFLHRYREIFLSLQ